MYARLLFYCSLFLSLWSALFAYQRQRPWWYDEDRDPPTPADANEKTEYAFARLQYPSYGGIADRIWNMRGNWTIDYPEADRHFVQGVRRLTRIHTRSDGAGGQSRYRRNL